jgi:hypothetical protein
MLDDAAMAAMPAINATRAEWRISPPNEKRVSCAP